MESKIPLATKADKSDNKQYVYAMMQVSGDETLYKIGRTNNIKKRLANLQVGNSVSMRAAYYLEVRDAVRAERILHTIFSAYRVKGEWFKLGTNEEIILRKIFRALETTDEEKERFERMGLT